MERAAVVKVGPDGHFFLCKRLKFQCCQKNEQACINIF